MEGAELEVLQGLDAGDGSAWLAVRAVAAEVHGQDSVQPMMQLLQQRGFKTWVSGTFPCNFMLWATRL